MVYEGILEGKYVDLKACTEDDAEFTLALRTDPVLGKFFPPVKNTVEQQRAWIKHQREKEGDYFFVVYNKGGERIGTIGVYNIIGDEGEGGRIIIKGDDPFSTFEASLLLLRFEFNVLNLAAVRGFIYAENKRAIRFNKIVSGKLFPPEKNENDELIIRAETTKDDFLLIDKKVSSIIY